MLKVKKLSGSFVYGPFEVRWEGQWVYDPNYGADDDGNRGMGIWLEDYLDFSVYDSNDKKFELYMITEPEELKDLEQKLIKEVEKEFLNSHEE
jgi:hypothetical protein